jgi:hypothetical protein
MGTKFIKHKIVAEQYPEMLRIKDMLELQEPFVLSSETEYTRNCEL